MMDESRSHALTAKTLDQNKLPLYKPHMSDPHTRHHSLNPERPGPCKCQYRRFAPVEAETLCTVDLKKSLNPIPQTLVPKPSSLNPKPEALNPKGPLWKSDGVPVVL